MNDEIDYLGYVVSREGITTQPKHIEAIMTIVFPKMLTVYKCS